MDLFQAALAVRDNAHAPYSRFKVGAAIRSAEGQVHTGCNVENVAYPQGTCAEAGAIAAMVAAGDRRIAEILVVAEADRPVPPCGGSRQKLAPSAGPDTPAIMCTTAGLRQAVTLADLLPGAFDAAFLPG